ncbi:P-loop containing nucleoside triphosphate hydrolase protein [Podospora australis]|uniref:DNA 3'-5' helicase n=1 Tax=Podospora australis TaxID=1536484 RepID=A0AAN6X0V5_9PEZI|nr:P-loop containing nucleoside triphosphate hydrolase protein [Podospora australis]
MPPPLAANPGHAILSSLNDAQRRAVSSDAQTVAILAGPGSGKTHTLTSRVVWLIDYVGIRPEDVIVATFTVKAAREMKERIGKALGNGREKKIVLGNFHSIARRYLAAYGRHIGLNQKFGIADDSDSRAIIARICKRRKVELDPGTVRAWISKKKAKGNEPEDVPKTARQQATKTAGQQDLDECYEEYQAQLEKSNLLDFDDLLVKCVELLREFPSCVSNIQTVLIDEYQDTNGIQYELMKLFAQKNRSITIVGDPDQSIYGWRSAEIKNLWRLLKDFPGTAEISLEQNYRSFQSILNNSLLVIQQDKKRYRKALKPVHGKGSRPVLRRLKSASAEADWIVSEMRRVIVMSGSMLNFNDVAILLRSASLSRHIESALGKSGIAYKMVGGKKFYERVEIKTLIDYLRVINQPGNNDALARIMNVPKRGIGEVTIKGLLEEAEGSTFSVWTILTKHCRGDRNAKTKITKHAEQRIAAGLIRPLENIRKKIGESVGPTGTPFGLVEMIEQLLTALDFEKHLKTSYPDDYEQRWANVQEFMNLAADFVRDTDQSDDDFLPEIEELEQVKEDEMLPRFLANVSLASDAQTAEDEGEAKPLVTISTIHAAKGLEWPIVFVPAVYNGSIPHMRAEDSDEERRLLYVAMTRAQTLLYLSCPVFNSNGNGERNELSPFIEPVHRAFANKGPCFDRPIMSEIAKILGRQLQSEDAIFKAMPDMFMIEDNLFPVDPEDTRGASTSEITHGTNQPPRAKRQKLSGPGGGHDTGEEVPWRKEYTTTMEQSSAFTVSALPGFTSASAHQAALAKASVELETNKKAQAVKRMAHNRPADQKSILGFVRSTSGSGSAALTSSQSSNHNLIPAKLSQIVTNSNKPVKPAIAPELAAHKLPAGNQLSRPSIKKEEEPVKRKAYTCFSSSPTKPAPKEEEPEPEEEKEPPEPTRAAACLHSTTFLTPVQMNGGIKRPTGLGRAGIVPVAPIEKLRKPMTTTTTKMKPFKPPTMIRRP